MSVYTDISAAARALVAGGTDIFTEADVVQRAGLSEGDLPEGRRHAPQVLASLFRASRVVRFGPVYPPELAGKGDYARALGHIIYASAERDEPLVTPNGEFDIIRYANDPIFNRKGGRPRASDRDDLALWVTPPSPDEVKAGDSAKDAIIASLRDEVARLRRENAELRKERDRALTEQVPDALIEALAARVRQSE